MKNLMKCVSFFTISFFAVFVLPACSSSQKNSSSSASQEPPLAKEERLLVAQIKLPWVHATERGQCLLSYSIDGKEETKNLTETDLQVFHGKASSSFGLSKIRCGQEEIKLNGWKTVQFPSTPQEAGHIGTLFIEWGLTQLADPESDYSLTSTIDSRIQDKGDDLLHKTHVYLHRKQQVFAVSFDEAKDTESLLRTRFPDQTLGPYQPLLSQPYAKFKEDIVTGVEKSCKKNPLKSRSCIDLLSHYWKNTDKSQFDGLLTKLCAQKTYTCLKNDETEPANSPGAKGKKPLITSNFAKFDGHSVIKWTIKFYN